VSSELGEGADVGGAEPCEIKLAGSQGLDKANALDVRDDRCGCWLRWVLLQTEERRVTSLSGDEKEFVTLGTEGRWQLVRDLLEDLLLSMGHYRADEPFKRGGSRENHFPRAEEHVGVSQEFRGKPSFTGLLGKLLLQPLAHRGGEVLKPQILPNAMLLIEIGRFPGWRFHKQHRS